jgi:hypothetical protein
LVKQFQRRGFFLEINQSETNEPKLGGKQPMEGSVLSFLKAK